MKLKGEIFYGGSVESDFSITDAIVAQRRISIDWRESGGEGHLDATARDGVHFKGNYGYPEKDANFEFELTLFKTKHEYLLFGTWCEHQSGNEGTWVFRLWTEMARPSDATTAINVRPSTRRTPQENISAHKQTSSARRQSGQSVSKAELQPARSAESGVNQEVSEIKSSQERGRTGGQKATAAATKVPPPSPPPSTQLDHLLEITPEQFDKTDQLQIAEELNHAPLSAVFKLAHNAKAGLLRSKADDVFAKRYKSVDAPQSVSQQQGPGKKSRPYLSRKRALRNSRTRHRSVQ